MKEIHSIIYLNILLQRIYNRKGKHFDWLAVENYVDKGGYILPFPLLLAITLARSSFFLLFEPPPVGVMNTFYDVVIDSTIVDLLSKIQAF